MDLFVCDRCGTREDVHADLSCPHCGPLMLCPQDKAAHARDRITKVQCPPTEQDTDGRD